jgi:MarR family transcriptional regulator, temperature-dependent positive regulator of motility
MTEVVDFLSAPGHLIRRAQQTHQRLWSELVDEPFTSIQFAVLALLLQQPGIDQRTLGVELSIDSSTLAAVCRLLEDRGLLTRRRGDHDTRRYELRATPAGEALIDRTAAVVETVGQHLLAPLDEAERSQFMALLRRIVLRDG